MHYVHYTPPLASSTTIFVKFGTRAHSVLQDQSSMQGGGWAYTVNFTVVEDKEFNSTKIISNMPAWLLRYSSKHTSMPADNTTETNF